MKKIILALVLSSVLAGCADEPPAPVANYSLPPRINLDVQSISLTDRSMPQPASSPYNSNDFQPTITQAVRQWAKDRLQAVGGAGQAMVIIKDATLDQRTVPYEHDIFTRQQASKYVAHVAIDIEAQGHGGYAIASAEASRFVTLPENPDSNERRKAYFDVLNGLMRDLGVNLEASIKGHMRDFVVSVPMFESRGVVPAAGSAVSIAPQDMIVAPTDLMQYPTQTVQPVVVHDYPRATSYPAP